MKKNEINEKRRQIATLWASGYTVSQIARELDVTRPTVYKVIKRLDDPECDIYDARATNKGRPAEYDELVQIIKAIRAKHPEWGPMFIRHQLIQENFKPVPSLREIARVINELGLAKKPIGPRDKRTYPTERINAPGQITIDLWGPWHIRASRIY
ncbi:MAG: hypothetical protein KatS3mg020_0915 [Fimbriimonadales bacterium]|nr:MAG: hypothetical protein KatS3mg020_0915 [Fimbriimonadales bacterium]